MDSDCDLLVNSGTGVYQNIYTCNSVEGSSTGLYFNFFWPPASRAGKVEKLLARIETYQPEKKMKGELSL